eukprot:8838933-Pyramimonas_sp.AAC.1
MGESAGASLRCELGSTGRAKHMVGCALNRFRGWTPEGHAPRHAAVGRCERHCSVVDEVQSNI